MRSRQSRSWLWFGIIAFTLSSLLWLETRPLDAQTTLPPDTDEEAVRQRQIIERFISVLERNPRRGTALDKIYGFHIENGSIETLAKQLEDRVAAKPDDGTGWMILGLVESQRGRDAAAVTALTKANEIRLTDPLAAYYLGQSLVLIGQPDKAVAAFEQAISRKPTQADVLEIFQALGRVHQRAQRNQEALAVWARLEKQFPGDQRVQEQIAVTLAEEGQNSEALPRYEALAKTTTDDYRRTAYRMEAAELKVKLNRRTEAIADFEQLLARLNPESWLFREVRRKIEDVFLRTDDQDGLATYYTKWLEGHADDMEAMARLARVLSRQARSPAAQEWLTKALRLAPSRKDLRLALIEQLVDDQHFAQAIEQYAELDKLEPNNPDVLRDWGKLILRRDPARTLEQRQAEAEKTWRRLLAARPADPLTATQVADLLRHAQMQPQALELYQRAVELAPGSPQYREYLGEYYHMLKRPDEALATWRKMAEGEARTATNVARLAEVLAQFGYLQQALPEIAAACELDPKDLGLQLKAADLALRGEQFETAQATLTRAEQLAQNIDERELVLAQQIKCFELQGTLPERAAEITRQTANGKATQHDWFLLARYREALHEYAEATKAIAQAVQLSPSDIASLAAAARIAEQAGDLRSAADQNRKLAVIDRRSRSTYLERVAGLEAQLGHTEESLAAGKELIAATPGNVETYQFFADLCFRLNRSEDGLAALRRATRINPNEPSLLASLAAALANQFRPQEAIEIYWQAYEKERELDDKLTLIARLTDLYLQTNHFDRLLERLERGRREADQRREMTIALAQAYQSAGDYGMARQELEGLLGENTHDTTLLLQLSRLAESDSDFAAAVKYQEQVVKLAPGAETEYRLAALLARAGDQQESAALMARLATKETDKNKLLRNIDGLLTNGQEEAALSILEVKVRENPVDWELLYRQGMALAKRDPVEAARAFEAILNQSLPDEELAAAAKAQQQRPGGSSPAAPTTLARLYSGPFYRLMAASQARLAVGIDPDRYLISTTTRRAVWMPDTHGQARLAAIGWLYRLAADQKKGEEFLAERRRRFESPTANVRELWDWLYLQTMRSETADVRATARRLAELGDLSGQGEFLQFTLIPNSLGANESPTGASQRSSEPLEPAELELLIRCFRAVQNQPQEMAARFSVAMMTELRRAGRGEEADLMYREITSQTDTPRQILTAMQVAAEREDMPAALALLDRFAKKDLSTVDAKSPAARSDRALLATAVQRMATAKQTQQGQLFDLYDHFMDYHIAWANQRRNNPLTRQPPTAANPTLRTIGTSVVSAGGVIRRVTFSYPTPTAYYDSYSLTLLRLVYEQFKQQDLVSDFFKHLERRASTAGGDKIYDTLAVAYAQVWNEDQEAAHQALAAAIKLAPQDDDLKLDTARLLVQWEKYDEALTLIDAVTPSDQRSLQQRETLALDLAVRLSDHQRAREAAQRLFGLRLDAETQVNLAGQMRRLGMDAEANAVLARSQRQAGSRPAALAALMQQYQAEGQTEQAVQVAQRLIRATRTVPSSQVSSGVTTTESQYRALAIQVLSKAGKLKEVIATLEDQIRRTPTATQLYESLAEYYQLAGDTQKASALTAKLVELKPDDSDLRLRYAQELYRQRKMPEACEQYKIVLKKQPQLISRRYFEVVQAFQQARKEAELVEVLSQIDLKSLGQSYMVTNLISTMMCNPQGRTAGLALFKKAWEAFPAERMRLMGYVGDELWKLPDVLDYAKQALRPTADVVRRDPWYGIQAGGMTFGPNGQVTSAVGRLISTAAQSNRLDEIRQEIAAAAAADANWQAGPILLALIDLKQKKEVDIPAVVKPLLDATGTASGLVYTRWIVGQELESRPEHRELAAQLYSLATFNSTNLWTQFQYSPGASLVRLYKQLGRQDEALVLMRKVARGELSNGSTLSLPASLRADSMVSIAKLFEELDSPAEALKIYRDVLADNLGTSGSTLIVPGQLDYYKQQAQQAQQALLARLGRRPGDLIAFLTPDDKAAPGTPAIDMMLGLGSPNAGPLRPIDSPLAQLIRPTSLTATERARIDAHLATLAHKYPRDLSVGVITALFALKGADLAGQQQSLVQLMRLMEQTPLDELPMGQRPNSRQRAEATQQVALWLVGRECLKLPDRRELGQKLADRAIAAAQRQVDQGLWTSILYERGRLSLDAKDRAAAERHWTELVDLAIVQPRLPRASTSAAAPSGTAKNVSRPSGPIPATASQFAMAATISQAAAEHDLVELSLRAIGESLSGGLPVRDAPANPNDPLAAARARAMALQPPGGVRPADPQQQAVTELTSRLWQLSVIWKQRQVPPERVFQLLASLVFPAARPGEILLHDQPQGIDLLTSRSIGGLLVDWASQADHGEELKRQVAARQAAAGDVTRGHLLLVELSIAERQPELAGPHLDALASQIDKRKLDVVQKRLTQAAPAPAPAASQPVPPQQVAPPQPAPQPKATPAPPAAEANVQSWWSDLDKTEAVAARALLNMADRPKETVAFLKQHLKPLKITADRVQTLLVNLGSEKEDTWKAAYEELEYFDPRLAIDLKTLMTDVTTSPARQRLVEVLSQRPPGSLDDKEVTLRPLGSGNDGYNFFDGRGSWWAEHRVERINLGGNMKKKWTQAVRAIILLEHIGTPDAIAILRDIATGHPDAQPTKLAAEALDRLAAKSP